MNGNGKLMKIIVQSGAVGITVMVLVGSYLLVTNEFRDSTNSRIQNTEVLTQVKAAVEESTRQDAKTETAINNLSRSIDYLAR